MLTRKNSGKVNIIQWLFFIPSSLYGLKEHSVGMIKKSSGFTLIEWMITITIGLFISAGILSVFTMSRETSKSALDNGELLEDGRLAMAILKRDLVLVGFLGDFTGVTATYKSNVFLSTATSTYSGNDCADNGKGGSGSFPSSTTTFHPVWAVSKENISSVDTSCINSSDVTLSDKSDIIDVKFANPLVACNTSSTTCSLDSNYFYIAGSPNKLFWFSGSETAPTTTDIPLRRIWQYEHHVYFSGISSTSPAFTSPICKPEISKQTQRN